MLQFVSVSVFNLCLLGIYLDWLTESTFITPYLFWVPLTIINFTSYLWTMSTKIKLKVRTDEEHAE